MQQPQGSLIDSAETIYVSGGRTKDLFAINAKTGAIKWKVTLGGDAFVSPIYTSGKIIVGASDNKIYAFDNLGNLSWAVLLNNSIKSDPIANNGTIYISDINSIYAFNSSNGSLLWRFQEGGTDNLIFKDNVIYCNSNYFYLYAINATNGGKKWEYFSSLGTPPVVFSEKIYYMVNDWTMLNLNTSNGFLLSGGGGWSIYADALSYNVKYGNIYVMREGVRSGIIVADSTNPSSIKFEIPIFTLLSSPPNRRPILADSFLISKFGVANAFTGSHIANVFGPSGVSYLNGVVYCVTSELNYYDPNTGGYYYAIVYAIDVKTGGFLWQTNIKDANFYGVEPCVTTRSGVVYRGAFQYK